jgi:hypothetical protein
VACSAILPASVDFFLGLISDLEDRCHVPPKRRYLSELHGVTTENVVFFIHTTMRTSNTIYYSLSDNFLLVLASTVIPGFGLRKTP